MMERVQQGLNRRRHPFPTLRGLWFVAADGPVGTGYMNRTLLYNLSPLLSDGTHGKHGRDASPWVPG